MEYSGYVKDIVDSILLVEAARYSHLKYQTSRPNLSEHNLIEPGKTLIINETVSGIKRWVDGKLWTSSRLVSGFFVYKELAPSNEPQDGSKKAPMFKKMISLINPEGEHVHLINYYTEPNDFFTSKVSKVVNFISALANSSQIKSNVVEYKYCKDFRTKEKSWKKMSSLDIRNYVFDNKLINWDEGQKERKVSTINLLLNTTHSQSSLSLNISELPSLKELDLDLYSSGDLQIYKRPYAEDINMFNEDVRQLTLLRKFLRL